MRLHDGFFWVACFFLAGVFIASILQQFGNALLISGLAILLIAIAIFVFGKRLIAIFSLVMFLGAGYYFFYNSFYQNKLENLPFSKKVQFSGVVIKAEEQLDHQKLVIHNVQISAQRYPKFDYGDKVEVIGIVKKPTADAENYFSKEGIVGLVQFPKINLISKNNGSPVKAQLFKIKEFFESSFKKVLPFQQATFLAGLTLGSTAEFSKDFEEKLRLSGTSHLVALSGYNISIIAKTIALILGSWWLTKRFSFPITVFSILGFVVMTGAEASVVRAAIMGFVLLLADQLQRPFYFRNALAATALAMVLINPKILAFDIGFQLSFAALLGIVYLRPWLQKLIHFKEGPGFLNWRDHFLNTTSAQLAVLPLLIYHFHFFSPLGVFSNILILEFVPITMALGFFVGFAAIISGGLAWLISWPASIFLAYEIGVINLCAKIANFFI